MSSNRAYTINLLRHELGWQGLMKPGAFAMHMQPRMARHDTCIQIYTYKPHRNPTPKNTNADYQEASRLEFWHHVANSSREAARLALTDTSTDQFTSQAVFPSDVLALVRACVRAFGDGFVAITWLWLWVSVNDTDDAPSSVGQSNPPVHTHTPPQVKDGVIPLARIDASVRRILQVKQWLGLFDDPTRAKVFATPGLLESVGSEEDKAAALAVARESIVLLKNNAPQGPAAGPAAASGKNSSGGSSGGSKRPVLPLAKGTRLLVTGAGCDSLGHQAGGWSVHWQGAEDWEFPYGTTIYQGLAARLGPGNVTLLVDAQEEDGDKDGDGEMDDPSDGEGEGVANRKRKRRRPQPPRRALAAAAAFRERLVAAARSEGVDAIVACVGEHPYAEKPGYVLGLSSSVWFGARACVGLWVLGALLDVAAWLGSPLPPPTRPRTATSTPSASTRSRSTWSKTSRPRQASPSSLCWSRAARGCSGAYRTWPTRWCTPCCRGRLAGRRSRGCCWGR